MGVKSCTIKDGDTRETHILNRKERDALLACSTGHTKAIITVALHTGMRLREILGLQWEDVDFRNQVITVKYTKSGKTRYVPMVETVREALNKENGSPYVFIDTRTGKPFNHIRRSFDNALKKAGIKDCCFHDLRHTAATLLTNGDPEAGVPATDVVTASEILGHADIKTTRKCNTPH
ncbi:MAG: site-specific integrase [Candidatus Brocadiales bacterium]